MGFSYTPEQEKVIGLRHRNMLVSAAAGSGKTAVLVERIVQMVCDGREPVDIDRLLIVTFTNAAASEMRERISTALAGKLEEQPDNEHLQKQAALLHNAQITTIDSFCLFVIRNNFNDIGLDPGFRVADEGELKLLQTEAMEDLMEDYYGREDAEFIHCLESFSTAGSEKPLAGHILRLYQYSMSNPWPEEWLSRMGAGYAPRNMEELEQSEFVRYARRDILCIAKDCADRLAEGIRISMEPDGPYMYSACLEQEREMAEMLCLTADGQEGFRGLYEAVKEIRFARLPSKRMTPSVQERENLSRRSGDR